MQKNSKPQRILIIGLTERMGGVETFIYNTTRFSDKKKYEYDYLVHGADYSVFQQEINNFYGDTHHIYFIRKYKVDPIGCIKDLRRFYKENGSKYSYVHLQTGATFEVLYIFPFNFKYNFKVIAHSHSGNKRAVIENSIYRPILNLVTYKRLACSTVAAEWLFGKSHIKDTHIINNGIDTLRFTFNITKRNEIREKYGIEDDFVIGHVGRFSVEKNHAFILKIFAEVIKIKPTAKLILVGVGEKKRDIENICNEMHIKELVVFAGKQNNTEDFYSAFDCFLMPSIYEGLPIVGVEAQSEGLPCFFSDTIDKQILVTDKARMLSLIMKPEEWGREIAKVSLNDNRVIYADVIKKSGYDIVGTVQKLEEVYKV